MSNDRNLFAVTQWVLKVAIVIVPVSIALLIVGAAALGATWKAGILATALSHVAAELPQVTIMIAGKQTTLDSANMVTADDAAKIGIVALTGAVAVMTLVQLILLAIRRIVTSASVGDPFIAKNANDLVRIAWLLVGIHVAEMLMMAGIHLALPTAISEKLGGVPISIPITGIFTVLLIFVLARIFKRGADMREELEGTV